MASSPNSASTMASMSKLSVDPASANKKSKPKKAPVADSWEDESDSDDGEPSTSTTATAPRSANGVAAPPPTPSTPTYNTDSAPWQSDSNNSNNSSSSAGAFSSEPRRPEKTDAVARRMIASALGVKAPRPTEEQRAYDRALREKERKSGASWKSRRSSGGRSRPRRPRPLSGRIKLEKWAERRQDGGFLCPLLCCKTNTNF
ncbi:hypothetical protein PG990_010254 [Apiospora arundinis]